MRIRTIKLGGRVWLHDANAPHGLGLEHRAGDGARWQLWASRGQRRALSLLAGSEWRAGRAAIRRALDRHGRFPRPLSWRDRAVYVALAALSRADAGVLLDWMREGQTARAQKVAV